MQVLVGRGKHGRQTRQIQVLMYLDVNQDVMLGWIGNAAGMAALNTSPWMPDAKQF